jgi:hypothetical protein
LKQSIWNVNFEGNLNPVTMPSETSKNGCKLIVLDQNAISLLALDPNNTWSTILDLLRSGVSAGRILCPTPVEVITESVHLSRSDRKRIEAVCDELSQGYYIKFFWQLIAQEILATVRPGADTFPLWIPEHRMEISDEENLKDAHKILKEKALLEKDINSFERPPKVPEFTIQQAQHMWTLSWFNLMRSHLNKFRNGQMIGDDQFLIQQILAMLDTMNITDREIAGLLRGIQSGRWLDIPLLLSWLFLDGLLLFDQLQRGRKFRGNDEWDKFRAAAAFHIAHCFITDRGMTAMLRQLRFEDPEVFEVFSVAEAKQIITYLKSIC